MQRARQDQLVAALRRRRRLFQVDWSRSKKREAQRKIDAARYDMDMDEFEAARAELDLLRGGLPQLVKIGLGDSSPVTGEKRKLEHALDDAEETLRRVRVQLLRAHWVSNSCKLTGL